MVQGFLQIAIFCALIVAVVPLLGGHMARVFRGERTFIDPVAAPMERMTYRLLRIDPERGQDWKAYARSVILFSLAGWLLLFVILRTQTLHPFNPESFHSGTWDLSFNTASSFVTNTNWQYYGGETHALLLQPDGRADGPELRLGRDRHRRRHRAHPRHHRPPQRDADAGQLLAGPRAGVVLHPAADLDRRGAAARVARRPADPGRHGRRPAPAARSPRRRRSRSWAPTAAASSTSTRPIRSRTPPGSRT